MWKRRILSVLLPMIAFLFACALQTTAWPDLFGSLTQPPLWLLILTWLSIYRPRSSTILLIYFLGFLASAFTIMPLKVIFFSLLILHVALTLTRERVFWTGTTYFVLASTASVAVYHISVLLLSRILEPVPAPWLVLERLLQIALAVPFAIPVYSVMNFLERPLQTDMLVDSEQAS